jgi:hypothetical protein
VRCKSSSSSTNSSNSLSNLRTRSSLKLFKMAELKMFSRTRVLSMESTEKTKSLMTLRERSKEMLKRDKVICIITTKNASQLVFRPRRLRPF